MTSHQAQLQALITEIDALLGKATPRLPWVMTGETSQQRRLLEQALAYLLAFQESGTLSPSQSRLSGNAATTPEGEATGVTPTANPELVSQQVLQALLQEIQYLRTQTIQPLTNEVLSLQQQRETLKNEVRLLELERLQQAEQEASPQLQPAWVNEVADQLRSSLMEQLTPQLRALKAQIDGTPALYDTVTPDPQEVAADLPQLQPQQRLEQLRQIQAQTDYLLLRLDSDLRAIFESMEQSIQSYCDSLTQRLDDMHSLGQQGEVIFQAFVNHLAQQLGQASNYLPEMNEGIAQLPESGGEVYDTDNEQPFPEEDSSVEQSVEGTVSFDDISLETDIQDSEEITLFQLDEEITQLQLEDEDEITDLPEDEEAIAFPADEENTIIQTEPMSWETAIGQVVSEPPIAADLPNATSDSSSSTGPEHAEIDALYESLFGDTHEAIEEELTSEAAVSTSNENAALETELDNAIGAIPISQENPDQAGAASPLSQSSPHANLADTTLENLLEDTDVSTETETTESEDVLIVAESESEAAEDTLETFLGPEVAAELTPAEATSLDSDIIASLSDLLPASEKADASQLKDPFATLDKSEDAFIPAPQDEDLLTSETEEVSAWEIDLSLDDEAMGQLTVDLSQLEGLNTDSLDIDTPLVETPLSRGELSPDSEAEESSQKTPVEIQFSLTSDEAGESEPPAASTAIEQLPQSDFELFSDESSQEESPLDDILSDNSLSPVLPETDDEIATPHEEPPIESFLSAEDVLSEDFPTLDLPEIANEFATPHTDATLPVEIPNVESPEAEGDTAAQSETVSEISVNIEASDTEEIDQAPFLLEDLEESWELDLSGLAETIPSSEEKQDSEAFQEEQRPTAIEPEGLAMDTLSPETAAGTPSFPVEEPLSLSLEDVPLNLELPDFSYVDLSLESPETPTDDGLEADIIDNFANLPLEDDLFPETPGLSTVDAFSADAAVEPSAEKKPSDETVENLEAELTISSASPSVDSPNESTDVLSLPLTDISLELEGLELLQDSEASIDPLADLEPPSQELAGNTEDSEVTEDSSLGLTEITLDDLTERPNEEENLSSTEEIFSLGDIDLDLSLDSEPEIDNGPEVAPPTTELEAGTPLEALPEPEIGFLENSPELQGGNIDPASEVDDLTPIGSWDFPSEADTTDLLPSEALAFDTDADLLLDIPDFEEDEATQPEDTLALAPDLIEDLPLETGNTSESPLDDPLDEPPPSGLNLLGSADTGFSIAPDEAALDNALDDALASLFEPENPLHLVGEIPENEPDEAFLQSEESSLLAEDELTELFPTTPVPSSETGDSLTSTSLVGEIETTAELEPEWLGDVIEPPEDDVETPATASLADFTIDEAMAAFDLNHENSSIVSSTEASGPLSESELAELFPPTSDEIVAAEVTSETDFEDEVFDTIVEEAFSAEHSSVEHSSQDGFPTAADQVDIAGLDTLFDNVEDESLGNVQIEGMPELENLDHPVPSEDTASLLEDLENPVPVARETPQTPPVFSSPESPATNEVETLLETPSISGLLTTLETSDASTDDALPPPQASLEEEWFLGLDLGTNGLSAVLMNRVSGTAHPLYWLDQTLGDNRDTTFRLPATAAFRANTEVDDSFWELQAISTAALAEKSGDPTLLLLDTLKPLLKVGIPTLQSSTAWDPIIQWTNHQTVPLQQVFAGVQALISLVRRSQDSRTDLGAAGLETAELERVLDILQGVVVGHPSNWSDTYRINVREAVLAARLVEEPSQIFFVEAAIAAVLSGLPDPENPPPEQSRQTQTLYQCHWQQGTVVISAGASCTELGIVDIPHPLDTLSREDFTLRNFAYGGNALDLDIICQLLLPPERRKSRSTGDRQSGTLQNASWQTTRPEESDAAWDSLALESLDLPQLAEPDESSRIRLRQYLGSSRLGQSLLEAARYLKLILQNQGQLQLELADQSWRVLRRDLEGRILVPYIQRLNQHLNALLSQTGLPAQGINQVICTGGTASFATIAKWLRQKFPNAIIIQDTYPNNRPPSCSRVAYGLVNLCRYPQVLDMPRHQYSDYFLLSELIRVVPDQPMPLKGILHLLEEQGINVDACQSRIEAILANHLPPGLIPDDAAMAYLSRTVRDNDSYQALSGETLFTQQSEQIYMVNADQRDRLRPHLAALLANKRQSLAEPLIAQLVLP